jgi:sugar O-acyltransferase (sialic acid O-acetyltransferase NeuD family)
MRPLVLVAASGLAREVLSTLERLQQFDVVGILDDEPSLHGTSLGSVPILGAPDAIVSYPKADVLLCVGRGSARRRMSERLTALGINEERYAVVADPSAVIATTCMIGAGSIVLAQSALTADVRLGRHVVVMPNVTLTHDDVVEEFATICAGVSLGGNVTIGEEAYVGMNASARERVIIGPGSTIGMGACVVNDVPAGEVWAGVPARSLTKVSPW